MLLYIAYILIAVTFFVFYKALTAGGQSGVSIYDKMRQTQESRIGFAKILLGILAPLNNLILKGTGFYDGIRRKLQSGKVDWTPGDFLAFREWLLLLSGIGLYLFNVKQPLVIIGVLFAAFIFPDIWLIQKIKQYKESIARVLPETVDLLSLCVGAGLDFMSAVRWIVRKTTPNPAIEQLKIVLDEINIGKPRTQALKDMAKRLDIPDVTSFARTLVQAERMGTPVEEAFIIISDDSRMRRKQRGKRLALKAPIKMLFPLIFCIMPIVLIVVGGPILLQFMTRNIFIPN